MHSLLGRNGAAGTKVSLTQMCDPHCSPVILEGMCCVPQLDVMLPGPVGPLHKGVFLVYRDRMSVLFPGP